MRKLSITLSLIIAAAPLAAQGSAASAPAAPPAGWVIHVDDAATKPEDTHFVTMGPGFHVTSGPAAIYYGVKDVATGSYTVKATFGQRVKPEHPEAYGVFVGGSGLADYAKQQYMYFLVRGDGMYFIAHRAGTEVHKIVDWTASDAVKKQNDAGAASNEVGIRITADSAIMMVNGTAVKGFAKSEMHGFNTDGAYGLRVNHHLNVHISNFGVQK